MRKRDRNKQPCRYDMVLPEIDIGKGSSQRSRPEPSRFDLVLLHSKNMQEQKVVGSITANPPETENMTIPPRLI